MANVESTINPVEQVPTLVSVAQVPTPVLVAQVPILTVTIPVNHAERSEKFNGLNFKR